jgi:hypothetical protein
LFAVSYDDQKVLREFSDKQQIPYPLLSDVDSDVIRQYGILNDRVGPEDAILYGIPYPGVFVTDEDGVVVSKFFHDSYKKRDSPELLIDAALGRIEVSEEVPQAEGGDEEVRITAFVHGGKGTIRQGVRRELVVRFELAEGLHIYGEPVPDGMIPTKVELSGPPGLVVEEPILPPTETLRLESMDVELPVWSGTVDLRIPFHAVGELASETRPLDQDEVTLVLSVRTQACNDQVCLLPKSERFEIRVPLDVIDVPKLGMHMGHGQREAAFDGGPHIRRLFLRTLRKRPLSIPRFLWKSLQLEREAARRRRGGQ